MDEQARLAMQQAQHRVQTTVLALGISAVRVQTIQVTQEPVQIIDLPERTMYWRANGESWARIGAHHHIRVQLRFVVARHGR